MKVLKKYCLMEIWVFKNKDLITVSNYLHTRLTIILATILFLLDT